MKISFRLFFTIMVFIARWASGHEASRPMPIYTNDLIFNSYADNNGTEFNSKEFSLFYLNRAQKVCALSKDAIIKKFDNFYLWTQIENYIPGGRKKWETLNVLIVIDSIASVVKDRSSYFLANFPKPNHHLIALDCALFKTSLWQSKLVHEIAHALLLSYDVPIWFEEMIAQNLESDFNTDYQTNAILFLGKKNYIPNPFKTTLPFSSPDRYAVNLILAQYLKDSLFKSNFMRDFILLNLKIGTSNLFSILIEKSLSVPQWLPKHLDEKTILKNFYLALVINQDDGNGRNAFRIDGWKGFSGPPIKDRRDIPAMEPNSAIRLSLELTQSIDFFKHPVETDDWDAYLIESSYNEYTIRDVKNLETLSKERSTGKNYEVLFINWKNTRAQGHFKYQL